MLPIDVFDRALMGFSLAVHIIIVAIGMALPIIISGAELMAVKYKDKQYGVLARRLTKALILFFAVGTASGTIVALELFVLWPKFMALVGQVAIVPVYLEVFAFFTEAIFLAIYVHSWSDEDTGYRHWLISIPVILGSAATAVLITLLNAFMNTPVGFDIQAYLQSGAVTGVDPLAVLTSPSAGIEVSHVLAVTYFAGLLAFAAYFAYKLLKTNDDLRKSYYKKALMLTIVFVFIATIAALITGIVSISSLYSLQPEKYAAIEADLVPMANAPEYIGGLFLNGTYQYYIAIPGLQSMLATGSSSGVVPGLSSYPKSTWPPLFGIHLMFDMMVGAGFTIGAFMFVVFLMIILKWRPFENKLVLALTIISGVLALVIMEMGWFVDEFARQPWIIYNVMLVSDAANYSNSVLPIIIMLALFYLAIIPLTFVVMKRLFERHSLEEELSI